MGHPDVRVRSTAAATAAVGLALCAGAVLMLWVLRSSLTQAVQDAAAQRAQDVAAALSTSGLTSAALLAPNATEQSVVQVLDPRGAVLLASADIEGEPALTAMHPAPGLVATGVEPLPVADEGSYVIAARGVQVGPRPLVVVVAQSMAGVDASVHTVGRLLLVGFPFVIAVVAGAVYLIVGRALAPVESIRRRVASISAEDLSQRVPVPRADDELSRLARTMNGMLDRLQRSQKVQRRFVSDASHELRSPLAALRATAEVAARYPADKSWQDLAPAIVDETDRLDRLVDDLLFLARSDEPGHPMRWSDVDLDDVLAGEVTRLRRSGVVVHAKVSPARVSGDQRMLERLVRNLCDNAARHAARAVTVTCAVQCGEVRLAVQDDGAGIAPGDRDRVFDRFVRLDAARNRDDGGSGLGLAIVAQVVRSHGGTVVIEDAGPGARFVVSLPGTDVGPQPTSSLPAKDYGVSTRR
jgi:signal transduction histidine kinase